MKVIAIDTRIEWAVLVNDEDQLANYRITTKM